MIACSEHPYRIRDQSTHTILVWPFARRNRSEKVRNPRIKGQNGTVGCSDVGPSRDNKVVNGLLEKRQKSFGEAIPSLFISDSLFCHRIS